MTPSTQTSRIISLLGLSIVFVTAFAPVTHGQSTAVNDFIPSLIQRMVGVWNVEQRMWTGSDAEVVDLPSAVARRRLVWDAFLEEIMELAPGSEHDPFTRVAYFNYNPVDRQFEYFSIDTRAPQMMFEESHDVNVQDTMQDQGKMTLYGGTFVAPRWGDVTNAAFKYRLDIGKVQDNLQVVRLYLTPLSGEDAGEFLAFEYVYTRQR